MITDSSQAVQLVMPHSTILKKINSQTHSATTEQQKRSMALERANFRDLLGESTKRSTLSAIKPPSN